MRRQWIVAVISIIAGLILMGAGVLSLVLTDADPFAFIIALLLGPSGLAISLTGFLAANHARHISWHERHWEIAAPARDRRTPGKKVKKKRKKTNPRHAQNDWIITDLIHIAAVISGPSRNFRSREWKTDLHGNPENIRYALGLIQAALAFRIKDLGRLHWRAACWVLASDRRTWIPILGVLFWCGLVSSRSIGLEPTIVGVIGAGGAANGLVEMLRKRWGVTVGPKEDPVRK
ncbi:hypothetical protein [Nonomuraea sp. NPDC048826]|uniref:hypothetical protein n=1 Tax=Nonomuraea sp. NPDC048826 TaxID=3364347 RepID=UPI0037248EDC